MTGQQRTWLLTGAAVLLAGGGGFTAARLLPGDAPAEAAAEHAEADEHGEGEAGHAEGGEHAGEGAEEGVVQLTAEQVRATGLVTTTVGRGGGQEVRLSGRAEPSPGARAAVGAPVGGVVERVLVAPGTPVRAGAALAIVRSAEGAVIRSEGAVAGAEADSARARAQAAAAAFAREDRLLKAGVVARQDWEAARATMLQAQAEVRAADAQAQAARARTAASGTPNAAGRTTLTTPISGVVANVSAAVGGYLAQGATVAVVVNPNLVEFVFNAPATATNRLTPGLRFIAQAADGTEFPAVVVGVVLDAVEASGAAVVRARPEGRTPAAGTPLSARLVTDAAGALTVPSEAVQTVEGRPSVFVVGADNRFVARPIMPGRTAGGQTEIVTGLTGGERIVARGAFLLKAELAKGEAEHGH